MRLINLTKYIRNMAVVRANSGIDVAINCEVDAVNGNQYEGLCVEIMLMIGNSQAAPVRLGEGEIIRR